MRNVISTTQFEQFRDYTAGMIADISTAHTGPYLNAAPSLKILAKAFSETKLEVDLSKLPVLPVEGIREAVIMWCADPSQAFTDYPNPRNITRFHATPRPNPLQGGNYAFKEALSVLLETNGLKRNMGETFISDTKPGRFECTMYQSSSDDGEDCIDVLLIRCNGPLDAALRYLGESVTPAALDNACRKALRATNMAVRDAGKPAKAAADPKPGF